MTTTETTDSSGELLKLSVVSKLSGIPADLIKMLADDGLLDGAERARAGHLYVRADKVPTWKHCITLIVHRRDRLLQRAEQLLDRLDRELEAVRNDIAEAREFTNQPLGVDLLALGGSAERMLPLSDGQPTVAAILQQFAMTRWEITRWNNALRDARLTAPDGDAPDPEPAP